MLLLGKAKRGIPHLPILYYYFYRATLSVGETCFVYKFPIYVGSPTKFHSAKRQSMN